MKNQILIARNRDMYAITKNGWIGHTTWDNNGITTVAKTIINSHGMIDDGMNLRIHTQLIGALFYTITHIAIKNNRIKYLIAKTEEHARQGLIDFSFVVHMSDIKQHIEDGLLSIRPATVKYLKEHIEDLKELQKKG